MRNENSDHSLCRLLLESALFNALLLSVDPRLMIPSFDWVHLGLALDELAASCVPYMQVLSNPMCLSFVFAPPPATAPAL